MTSGISKDLFLAILSMDSYNRGYGEGVLGLGGVGDFIGLAEIIQQSGVAVNHPDRLAGFYAVAYDTKYGTVISYRGTDGDWDYLKGWLIGLGLTSDWTQADEALNFYKAVTGKEHWEGRAENTIVTGHSLGGGHRKACPPPR